MCPIPRLLPRNVSGDLNLVAAPLTMLTGLFKGAIMVKRNAQAYIEGTSPSRACLRLLILPFLARLRNSKFSERTEDIVDAFDKSTKLTFKNAKTPAYVKFGGISDADAAYDVKGGKLVIPG